MGASESKSIVNVLNETITNITSETVMKHTAESAGSIDQELNLTFSGTGSGIDISQSSTINLSLMKDAAINSTMQSEMINKISDKLNTMKRTIPVLAVSSSTKNDTQVKNIVENNVTSTFNHDDINQMNLGIFQTANIEFTEGSNYTDVMVDQMSAAVGEMIINMSSTIITELAAGTEFESQLAETTEAIGGLKDTIGGIGGLLGGVFGDGSADETNEINANQDPNTQSSISSFMFFIIVALVIMGGMMLLFGGKKRSQFMPPYPPQQFNWQQPQQFGQQSMPYPPQQQQEQWQPDTSNFNMAQMYG